MGLEADGTAWGALLLSSNGMDIVPTEDRLSWRAIGGVLDVYIMLGPTPLDVMDQYTQLVGRPAMQPHWSLGWHQCKYGYKSVWEVEEVVANYSAAKIPLEVMWTGGWVGGWVELWRAVRCPPTLQHGAPPAAPQTLITWTGGGTSPSTLSTIRWARCSGLWQSCTRADSAGCPS